MAVLLMVVGVCTQLVVFFFFFFSSSSGNSGLSWSDVLLGNMPNVYVYAANNPSESILAKRRGYGTIISHNVPPYAR